MKKVTKDNNILPATPPFVTLVDDKALQHLSHRLSSISHYHYDIAECVRRDVRRVPLKPNGLDDKEVAHLSLSSDGLRFFHPYTLYPDNCQSSTGLLAVLGQLTKLQDMGSPDCRSYSVINVDVSLYNMFMHMMYGIAGMQPFLNNVFFLYGTLTCTHTPRYGIGSDWHFLFALFPKTILMRKPSLFKSSVFFTWLRISYPDFRDELRERLIEFQLEYLSRQGMAT